MLGAISMWLLALTLTGAISIVLFGSWKGPGSPGAHNANPGVLAAVFYAYALAPWFVHSWLRLRFYWREVRGLRKSARHPQIVHFVHAVRRRFVLFWTPFGLLLANSLGVGGNVPVVWQIVIYVGSLSLVGAASYVIWRIATPRKQERS